MTKEQILLFVREQDGEDSKVELYDGFEDAFMGLGFRGTEVVAVYDYEKCEDTLIVRDGMSRISAEKFFSHLVSGLYVSEHTPVFTVRPQ